MGQKLRDDKIGALSHGSGIITMSASSSIPVYLTIGGQQFKLTSSIARTISTDVTLVAHNLYMIYAVRNSGNTELRISSNVNSVGPSGFASWKLVGAFYANSTPAFGVFVNITGVPETGLWAAGTVTLTDTAGTATKGGSPFVDRIWIRRSGNRIYQEFEYRQTTSGNAGGGQYLITLPGFTVDQTFVTPNTGSYIGAGGAGLTFSTLGYGEITDGSGINAKMLCQLYTGGTQFRAWLHQISTTGVPVVGGWGANFFAFSNATLTWSCKVDFPAVGLTNTQLVDL